MIELVLVACALALVLLPVVYLAFTLGDYILDRRKGRR